MSEQALEKQASDTVGPYRELLESALERSGGTHTYEDVLDAIILGDMFFWPADKSRAQGLGQGAQRNGLERSTHNFG